MVEALTDVLLYSVGRLLHRFPTYLFRLGRKLLPCQSGDGSDCDQERWPKSWAGVYVDAVSKEVLHLEAGGGASLSPGTSEADFGRDCLRWTADEEALRLVDCQGRPFTWTGDGGDVRRDSMHAGKRAGFGAVSTTDGDEIFGNGPAHLVRDPFGFVFPGCAYSLSMRQWSQHNTVHEVRVVINHDGSVTDGASGGRVASWSFAGMESLPAPGDESWAAGDAIVLLLDACYQQVRLLSIEPLILPKTCVLHALTVFETPPSWGCVFRLNHEAKQFHR